MTVFEGPFACFYVELVQWQKSPAMFAHELNGQKKKVNLIFVKKVRYIETSKSGLKQLVLNEKINILFGLIEIYAQQMGRKRTGTSASGS